MGASFGSLGSQLVGSVAARNRGYQSNFCRIRHIDVTLKHPATCMGSRVKGQHIHI